MNESSPLNGLQDHTWTENGPEVANALALHEKAQSFQRQAEQAYTERDNLLSEIDETLKSSRDLLLSIFRDNPKTLGQWGFEVDDSPRTPAKKPE